MKLITADETYHDSNGSFYEKTKVLLTTPPSAKMTLPEYVNPDTLSVFLMICVRYQCVMSVMKIILMNINAGLPPENVFVPVIALNLEKFVVTMETFNKSRMIRIK